MITNKLTPAIGKVYKNKNQKTGKSFLVVRFVPEEVQAQLGSLEELTGFSLFINQVESKFDNNFVGFATLVKNREQGEQQSATPRMGTTVRENHTSVRENHTVRTTAPKRFTSLLED